MAQEGRTKEVRKLLLRGADVNYPNGSKWTALHKAAMKGHADTVSLLLEKGADPEARTSYGFTALHIAAHNDRSGRCAAHLVKAPCDVNRRNQFGRTALHYAAECGNDATARALVKAGASVGVKDDEGKTPMDLARTDGIRRVFGWK